VVKALADLGGAPAGLLLIADDQYRLSRSVAWNWSGPLCDGGDGAEALARFVENRAFVLDFEKLRGGWLVHGGEHVPVPLVARLGSWRLGGRSAHPRRASAGLVILAHPHHPPRRSTGRITICSGPPGIQAASYIAEARSQQALADSRAI
jgi:hypothetical protein